MEIKEIEIVLDQVNNGDFSKRIDERQLEQDLIPIARRINKVIDQLVEAADTKRRSDVMIQNNPLAIAVLRKDKSRISINKQYEIAWRGSNEELMRKKLYDFEITVLSGEHFYACFETKKLAVTEALVKWPDGVQKYLTLYAIPILDQKGEIDGAFYVWVDYTDAHKKMEEVKQLEYRVDTMIANNPLAIAVLRKDKSRISINKQYEIAWRGSNEELMRKKLYDFDITVLSGEHFYACFETKKLAVTEALVKWPDGVQKYLTLNAIPILDQKGEIDGAFYVWVDYTDSHKKMDEIQKLMDYTKQKEQALRESADILETGLSRMAGGDLTFTAEINENDPLVALKKDYNKATASIKSVIEQISQSSHQLDLTTAETTKSTQEISKSTEQVAIATQESAEGTKKQLEEMEKVSKDVSDLSSSIEEIASTTHDLMTHAQKAATDGNQAADLGKTATAKMKAVEKISADSVAEITALNDRMKEISKIVKLIADISSQTNLLALNAAIEAARAGEHGRGFAVVAGEVRNLAGESKSATGSIENLIGSIQSTSEKTAAAINNSHQEIQTGIESVNQTIDVLNRIISESNIVAQGVTEITKATEAQAEATNRVVQGMEQTNSLSRETRQRMEDMAALAEQTSASTEEIASASSELSMMAKQLKSATDKFKLR